jgi:hypothetical protein
MYGCIFFWTLREPQCLRDYAKELMSLAEKAPFFTDHANFYAGQALLWLGSIAEGREKTLIGVASWKANDFRLARTLELDAEARFKMTEGRLEEALAALTDATQDDEEVLWRSSPILAFQADLLALSGIQMSGVEAAYREAIDCARRQGSRLYELEAATHFASWLKAQDRNAEARTMLAEIYDWFTEGFDTLDLKEAKALIDGLND